MSFIILVLPARAEENNPKSSDRVAIVNGVPINREEFEGEVLRIQKALIGFAKPLTCNQIASVQTEVLESMIRREVLYQYSRKSGIKPDEDAVNKEIQALKQQFSNETEYKNELARRNISEEILRSRIERNNSIQQYIEKQFVSKATVTDNDMVEYYQSHLDLFKQPLQIRVSHILIQTDPKWEAPRKQEARIKIEQILKNLKKGQDFAATAKMQSDGPTKANGGDLGYITIGQLDKQFESTVFALDPGQISDIIETDYGFHLFKVTDKKPETVLAYENVKEKIQQFLRNEKAKQEADLQAKALREKANVVILLPDQTQKSDKQAYTSSGN
jgi:peptidyl-prolyl cis-trans isomerase C